jgi:hypothetical protein
LPYTCAIDHVLDPQQLSRSAYAVRESSLLRHPLTPAAVVSDVVHVLSCDDAPGAAPSAQREAAAGEEGMGGARTCDSAPNASGAGGTRERRVRLPRARPPSSVVRAALGGLSTVRRLHFDDVRSALGSLDDAEEHIRWHEEAQSLLASWCCTSAPGFSETRGLVPYELPPLDGQRAWRGRRALRWVARALKAAERAQRTWRNA